MYALLEEQYFGIKALAVSKVIEVKHSDANLEIIVIILKLRLV